jgi:ABC-type multidrug transport system ATPase subunit
MPCRIFKISFMYCLATDRLSHTFSGNRAVLNEIGLRVPEGSIYGFLGPNGAGKTTTLRLVLGLLTKKQGAIFLFGESFEKNRVAILRRVGSLIETPSLYGHLSAFENLDLWRRIYQCPKERIPKVLQLVGLADTGNKRTSRFSLGMKQRLGIAIALLNDPSLLILDEPTNGLDPNGIIEIRELLKKLNQERGITILISSHLLSEIEKQVTHVGIINNGSLLFQGTLEELIHQQRSGSVIVWETSDALRALQVMKDWQLGAAGLMGEGTGLMTGADGMPGAATGPMLGSARIENGKVVMPLVAKEAIAILNRRLVRDGIDVYEISMVKNDLETIFIDLINN